MNTFNNAVSPVSSVSPVNATNAVNVLPKPTLEELIARQGEKVGVFKPYDSANVPVEIDGTRIIKALYQKNPKTGTKKQENAYTRIKTSHLTVDKVKDSFDALAPFIVGWLESIEDSIIKESHSDGNLTFFTEKLSVSYLLSWLEANAETGRLTKEMITDWFNNNLEIALCLVVGDKLGFGDDIASFSQEQLIQVNRVVSHYRDNFESLASPKVSLKESDVAQLINVIEKYELNDAPLSARLVTKLKGIKVKQVEDLLAL